MKQKQSVYMEGASGFFVFMKSQLEKCVGFSYNAKKKNVTCHCLCSMPSLWAADLIFSSLVASFTRPVVRSFEFYNNVK